MLRPEMTYAILGFITLGSLAGFILLFMKLNRITRQLISLADSTSGEAPKVEKSRERTPFDAELVSANMKAMLCHQAGTMGVQDRYRYIRSLASHGLEPHQIADILNIGRGEAEQLVKLARLRAAEPEATEAAA